MNRVEFTRDCVETHAAAMAEPLNYFVYPYAEADGRSVDDLNRTFSWRDRSKGWYSAIAPGVKILQPNRRRNHRKFWRECMRNLIYFPLAMTLSAFALNAQTTISQNIRLRHYRSRGRADGAAKSVESGIRLRRLSDLRRRFPLLTRQRRNRRLQDPRPKPVLSIKSDADLNLTAGQRREFARQLRSR
jgi:hypothetical protein